MLVATPGQTAYLHNSSSSGAGATAANKKICHAAATTTSSANATAKNQSQPNFNAHKPNSTTMATATARPPLSKMHPESSSISGGGGAAQTITTTTSSASALMKTLSVRLNRGTEFLKGTMQKALIASANSAASASAANSNNSCVVASSSSTVAAAAAAAGRGGTVPSFPPTATHRFPQEERLQAGSTDSLHKEMCHFKPIRSAPTTRWKCSSKSRGGASIKIPKANLATKPVGGGSGYAAMFDVDVGSDEDANEVVLRPKSSCATLRTTINASPTSLSSSSSPTQHHHSSAFVCLVAQMKSINTTQSQPQQSKKSLDSLHKTKSSNGRGRTKGGNGGGASCASMNQTNRVVLRHLRNPFVPVKKLHLPTPTSAGAAAMAANEALIVCRSTRSIRSNRAAASAASAMMALSSTVKPASLPIISTAASASKTKSKVVTAAAAVANASKSKSKLTKVVPISDGGDADAEPQRRQIRKRKLSSDLNNQNSHTTISSSNVDAALEDTRCTRPIPRKSARLSKDHSGGSGGVSFAGTSKINSRQRRNRYSKSQSQIRVGHRLSPPLTRSRLKQHLSHFKLNPALEFPHRAV